MTNLTPADTDNRREPYWADIAVERLGEIQRLKVECERLRTGWRTAEIAWIMATRTCTREDAEQEADRTINGADR